MLTIGSLFSGIGGLELGLEWSGLGCVSWQVEIDPFCRRVLAKHWPEAVRFDDVRLVGAATLAPVDVLCGGFPCQDVSLAGRGAGLSGARSGLWFDYLRIVKELRPSVVIVENVPGLLRRGLDTVVTGLSLAGDGYTVEGTRLRAEDLGAPHRRERLFLVAYALGFAERLQRRRGSWARGPGEALAGRDGEQGVVADAVRGGWPWGGANDAEIDRGPERAQTSRRSQDAMWPWTSEPDVGRVAHGVPARVDRLRGLGNAVVPMCGYIVGRRIIQRLSLIARAEAV